MLNVTGGQHESLSDKIHRFRGLFLVISVPLLLISFLLFLMPARYPSDSSFPNRDLSLKFVNRRLSGSASSTKIFAVIFDAGSSGSRVHVFCFDKHLNLIPIGKDLELFQQTKPGLSAYAKDPKAAADSLLPLLEKAESVVPTELRHQTPVRVGATAGLRLLQGDAPDKILQAVRDLLKEKSTLKSKPEWIKVLDGTEEGAYQWMTINYLLENLGKKYMRTVGVVDMGGGSVQMAYAISDKNAAKAPTGNETYVKKMSLRGRDYHLYVHSYLKYGLLAARAEILKVENSGSSPCILVGYNGSYEYGGASYPASSSPSGSSMNKCRRVAIRALKIESPCKHPKCTFDGVWNGGGGKGQKNLYFSSFFYDKAAQVGFVDPNVPVAKVRPIDFGEAAKRACGTKLEEAKSAYPSLIDLPYICMDLVYQFALLVDGFGLDPWLEITLVKQVKYHGYLAEAAWPLGSAIDVVSSPM